MLCQQFKALRGPSIPFMPQVAIQYHTPLDFLQIMKLRKSLIRHYWFPRSQPVVQILLELAKIL